MPNIGFKDESGDREHFTIIPNYIANHSTAIDQSLYFQMKKHAGENGECFVSKRNLMKKMGIGKATLNKSIKYLLDHKWICEKGFRIVNTAGGEQAIQVYGINNIWKMNSDYYDKLYKGESNQTPLVQNSSKVGLERLRGESETAPNKNHNTNKISEEDFSLEDKEKKRQIALSIKRKLGKL